MADELVAHQSFVCVSHPAIIIVLEIVYSVQQGPTNAIGRDGFTLFVTAGAMGHCPIALIYRICRDGGDKLLYSGSNP